HCGHLGARAGRLPAPSAHAAGPRRRRQHHLAGWRTLGAIGRPSAPRSPPWLKGGEGAGRVLPCCCLSWRDRSSLPTTAREWENKCLISQRIDPVSPSPPPKPAQQLLRYQRTHEPWRINLWNLRSSIDWNRPSKNKGRKRQSTGFVQPCGNARSTINYFTPCS